MMEEISFLVWKKQMPVGEKTTLFYIQKTFCGKLLEAGRKILGFHGKLIGSCENLLGFRGKILGFRDTKIGFHSNKIKFDKNPFDFY